MIYGRVPPFHGARPRVLYRLVSRWVAHNNEINPGVNSAPRNVVGREAVVFLRANDRSLRRVRGFDRRVPGRPLFFFEALDPHCGSHFFEIESPRPDLGLLICGSAEQGCHKCRGSHIPKAIFHPRKDIAKGKEKERQNIL